jgi:phage-related protein
VTTTRINYVKNPSFRGGSVSFWQKTIPETTLQASTDDSVSGDYSLRVSLPATKANSGIKIVANTELTPEGYRMPVTPGLEYTLSAFVKISNLIESRTFRCEILWFEDEEALVPLQTFYNDTTVFGVDNKFASVSATGTAPFALPERPEYPSAFAEIQIYQLEAEATNGFYLIDAIMFEQNGYVNSFFESITQDQETNLVNTAMRPVPLPNITGMELNADITLNGLQLNTIDEDGIVWVCTDLEGWWGQPEPEVPDISRGLGDGSYDVRGRYATREISLSGVFFPPTKDLVDIARDKLVVAIDLVKNSGYLVVDEEPPKASLVRLVDKPQITTVSPRGKTEFSLTLRAPDPIKYEWVGGDENGRKTETINLAAIDAVGEASLPIQNIGNTPVPLLIEVHGPTEVGTYIANLTNDSIISLAQPLRSKSTTTKTITHFSRQDDVVTAFFATETNLAIGDFVDIENSTNSSGSVNGTNIQVIDVVNDPTAPSDKYYIQYTSPTLDLADFAKTSATGTSVRASLNTEDILTIDTYRQEVYLNGESSGYRFFLDTLSDWFYLETGVNSISFGRPEVPTLTGGYIIVLYRSGWIG